MTVARGVLTKKLALVCALFVLSGLLITLVPPVSLPVIFAGTLLVSLSFTALVKTFFQAKYALITFLVLFVFLSLRVLGMLDPINAVLGLSLIAGVVFLIK